MAVTGDEIRRVANMMRIDLGDHTEHIDRIREMLEYFEILDKAGIGDDELGVPAVPMDGLRPDKHIAYDDDLLRHLKTYKGRHVRAPRTAR